MADEGKIEPPTSTPQNAKKHIALRGVFPNRRQKPCIPADGLGVVEQVFYRTPPGRPQVVMGCCLRLRNPPAIPRVDPERVLDLVKMAAARHWRLCVGFDPETLRSKPLAETAATLPILSRVVNRTSADDWKSVFVQDINANFDLADLGHPLWRVVVLCPPVEGQGEGEAKPREEIWEKAVNTRVANSLGLVEGTVAVDGPRMDTVDGLRRDMVDAPRITDSPVVPVKGHVPEMKQNGSMSTSPSRSTLGGVLKLQIVGLPVHDDAARTGITADDSGVGSEAVLGHATTGRAASDGAKGVGLEPGHTQSEVPSSPPGLDGNKSFTLRGRRGSRSGNATPGPRRFFTTPATIFDGNAEAPSSPTISREWALGNWKVEWLPGRPFPRLIRVDDSTHEMAQVMQAEEPADGDSFEIVFTFNHVLGDGLSMWAFMRTLFEVCTPERLSPRHPLGLEDVLVTMEPPPIIDNLLRPNVVEILPVIVGMSRRYLVRKSQHRFKGRTKSFWVGEHGIAATDASLPPLPSLADEDDDRPALGPEMASMLDPIGPPAPPVMFHPATGRTKARFFTLDPDATESLRKKCNTEKTSVAAAMVVSALAAIRTVMESLSLYAEGKRKLPSRQGWVVTSSVRHLLPNCTSLQGGDRYEDPALKIFGGYGGSILNNNLRFKDEQDFWERCRRVRRDIRFSYRSSIMRMKLVNWCYRQPRIWTWLNSKANLSKLSRAYSVELANLGAWDAPCAVPGVGASDPRLRLEGFNGLLNSSFDGVRGLFSIGCMTLAGSMAVTVSYDVGAVLEADADLFMESFRGILQRAAVQTGKFSVLRARKG